jgi:predicted short-subunit dehydrogenase-like oxidoreductase (DUF2520 family)
LEIVRRRSPFCATSRTGILRDEMKTKRTRGSKIAIVGAGKFGSALAEALYTAGFRISEILSRPSPRSRRRAGTLARRVNAKAAVLSSAALDADVVWLCVPDREIAGYALQLARSYAHWKGKIVLHSSGALSGDELKPLRSSGAYAASAHPLMTFVGHGEQVPEDVPFAVEGDRKAVAIAARLIRGIGGRVYPIRKEHKAAYHAWGFFASPLLTSLLTLAEKVASEAGVRKAEARRRMVPIVLQTVKNYARWGGARGFSGPLIRGDFATVEKHLRVLRRVAAASDVYRALARAALKNLPAKHRKELERALRK